MINKLAAMILLLVLISPVSQAPAQPSASRKTLRVLIEGDHVMVEMLNRELREMLPKTGPPVSFAEKGAKSYDWRMLLASGAGSKSGHCHSHLSHSSHTAIVTLYFVSAAVMTPEGNLQYTETGLGSDWREARKELARKLAYKLSL